MSEITPSPDDALAQKRYYVMVGVNLAATAGAVLGLLVAGRSTAWPSTVLGGAILLSALYVMAVVPRALARRWRSPRP